MAGMGVVHDKVQFRFTLRDQPMLLDVKSARSSVRLLRSQSR
jgi:hypothetical protein